MTSVRKPAVAGLFYPADPRRLREDVESLLEVVPARPAPCPAALIVPHAGYEYSGPTAAAAYGLLRDSGGDLRSVVLVGPSHYVWVDGAVLPGVAALATPLAEVPVDDEGERIALEDPSVAVEPEAHRREHSLEVQLPFLQLALGSFSVVALLTGGEGYPAVARVMGSFLGRSGTVVIVSSDLSHYLPDAAARRRDARTAGAIEALRPDAIGREDACGRVAVQGLLAAARRTGLEARRLDLRNSSDTAGPPDRVVGYGSWAFS